jgi:hypothetical protein
MYKGLPLSQLPEQAILHELKVRIPEHILMHDDKSFCVGYLVHVMGDWFISPVAPPKEGEPSVERPLYLLVMENCDPQSDIVVEE